MNSTLCTEDVCKMYGEHAGILFSIALLDQNWD